MSAFFPVFVNAPFREDTDDLTLPQSTKHGPHGPHIMGASVDWYVVGYLAEPSEVTAVIDLSGGEENDRTIGCGGQHHGIAV
jgi:hypothetical protein